MIEINPNLLLPEGIIYDVFFFKITFPISKYYTGNKLISFPSILASI